MHSILGFFELFERKLHSVSSVSLSTLTYMSLMSMDTVLLYTDRFLSVVRLISYIPKERIVSGPESSPGSYIELCCHFSLVSFNLNSSSFFLCLCGLGIFWRACAGQLFCRISFYCSCPCDLMVRFRLCILGRNSQRCFSERGVYWYP